MHATLYNTLSNLNMELQNVCGSLESRPII
jgi:hypothetical protein